MGSKRWRQHACFCRRNWEQWKTCESTNTLNMLSGLQLWEREGCRGVRGRLLCFLTADGVTTRGQLIRPKAGPVERDAANWHTARNTSGFVGVVPQLVLRRAME